MKLNIDMRKAKTPLTNLVMKHRVAYNRWAEAANYEDELRGTPGWPERREVTNRHWSVLVGLASTMRFLKSIGLVAHDPADPRLFVVKTRKNS